MMEAKKASLSHLGARRLPPNLAGPACHSVRLRLTPKEAAEAAGAWTRKSVGDDAALRAAARSAEGKVRAQQRGFNILSNQDAGFHLGSSLHLPPVAARVLPPAAA